MRLVDLQVQNYDALIHDLIKNTTILLVIEVLQRVLIGDQFLDKVFLTMLGFTIVGNFVYYLVVDKFLVGAGPVLSGAYEEEDDDEEEAAKEQPLL
jgi:hypothetical protein